MKPRQSSRKRKAGQAHPAPQVAPAPPTTNQAREITGAVLNLLSEMLLCGLAEDGLLELSFAELGALVAGTCEICYYSNGYQIHVLYTVEPL